MKKHNTAWWIRSSLAGVILAVPVFFIAYLLNPCEYHHARQHILAADPHTLLMACREMIANRENYRTNWTDASGLAKGDRVLSREREEYGQDVPEIIRKMNPLDITISTNRVFVFVYGPPRTGFIGYSEGVNEEAIINEEMHTIQLTNGLWRF